MDRSIAADIVRAFTERQVERLTGVSVTQLRYWDRTGFFRPSLSEEVAPGVRRVAYSRVYSFRDVASLRVLHALRNESKVPLQHLRDVGEKLAQLSDDRWLSTTLYVLKKRVVFSAGDADRYEEVVGGQLVIGIALKEIAKATERAIEALADRSEKTGKVERKRNVSHNAPVIAGTRIPVAAIQRLSEDGFGIADIMREYPTLTEDDVKAAMAHNRPGQAAA